MSSNQKSCDLLVLGGGPGGFVCADRAKSKYGVTTILVEASHLGGTCVNVGCKPKKLLWNAASIISQVRAASSYCFSVQDGTKSDWAAFKSKRDDFIHNLQISQEGTLSRGGVVTLYGQAHFMDSHTVRVQSKDKADVQIRAKHILIAVGGRPNMPSIEGATHGITSDEFFSLQQQPKKVAVVGAGYIAVEMAGMLHAFGSETHMFIRKDTLLRNFDPMIQNCISEEYQRSGIVIHKNSTQSKVELLDSGQKRLHYRGMSGDVYDDFDTVLWAIGRSPVTSTLNLGATAIQTNNKSQISVDEYQSTNVPHIYSVGDACSSGFALTPVALAAGMHLANRLFGKNENGKLDYRNIPSVVFSHPEVGSIGMTEPEAQEKFGDEKVKIYTSTFLDLYYAMMDTNAQVKSTYKLVCVGEEEKIVGLHIFGRGSGEILQGFAVAIKMGATKSDFDSCVAIHPTSGEEIVTMK